MSIQKILPEKTLESHNPNLYPDDYPNKKLIVENDTYSQRENERIALEDVLVTDNEDEYYNNNNHMSMDVPNRKNRNCLGRWFSKITSGSLRGSTFAMASITFGGGCLAFPSAIAKSGPVLGIIIFIAVAIFSYTTLRYLLDNGLRNKILDYNALITKASGNTLRIIADINNIILCLGVIMSYQYMIYNFVQQLMWEFFDVECTSMNKVWVILVCIVLFQIPLGLLKNISVLQYASILATFALVYAIIVIVIEMPFYWQQYLKKNPGWYFTVLPHKMGLNWVRYSFDIFIWVL